MIQLRDYQIDISQKACELLNTKKIAYLALEMRCGKTIISLETATLYGATKVLFITKKKAIKSIENDCKHYPNLNVTVINYESVTKKADYYDLVVIDEAHALGAIGKPNKRQKEVKQIVRSTPIIFLSGTPSPEHYSQFYYQMWVSAYSVWSHYPNFYKWAKDYVDIKQRMINGRLINDYTHAIEAKVKADINPYMISFTQKEAGFENQVIEKIITVEMPNMIKLIEQLKKNKIIEGKVSAILADTPAKEMQKVAQLSGGTIITEDGEAYILDKTKAEYIKEYCKGMKIAIMYQFRKELELLKEVFPNYTEDSNEFEQSNDRIYLGQAISTREGVKLATADALVMYGIGFSATTFFQLLERHVSKERTTPAYVYYFFTKGGIEQQVYKAVKKKENFTLSHYKKC